MEYYNDRKIAAYLNRIHYDKPIHLDGETLGNLQLSHLKHIPYENLDILLGLPLSLDPEDLFNKIIRRPRGGYCFELQGLYANLLQSLGFPVTQFLGRFIFGPDHYEKRHHRVLQVEAQGERFICDVGVRSPAPRLAIRLEEGLVQTDGISEYRFERDPFFGWVLWQKEQGQGWKTKYGFTEDPQQNSDFVVPSFYCEKHPGSAFNKIRKIGIFTDDSIRSLDHRTFQIYRNAAVEARREVQAEKEITPILWEQFGIRMD